MPFFKLNNLADDLGMSIINANFHYLFLF